MILLQEEIIQNLNNRLLQQTVIINTLCDILVNSNIISEKKLRNLIDKNLSEIEFEIKKMEENEKTEELLHKTLSLFKGPIGEA